MYKIKNNDDFIIFLIYPDLSFPNLSNSNAQYWRQLNKVLREEYWCTSTNPNFNSENRSPGLETGHQKINAIADDELHNLILNWSSEPIILISLQMMSVLSSELCCHFLTTSRNFNTGHGGGIIFNTDICSRGKIWTKQKANVRKNNLFLRYCLREMNATG